MHYSLEFEDALHVVRCDVNLANEVEVSHVDTSVSTTRKRNRCEQTTAARLAIATCAVAAASISASHHCNDLARLLLQVDVCAVAFVEDTYTRPY